MVALLHIIPKQEAEAAKASGVYKPASLSSEGFIHCSYANQVCRVANFLFKGNADLALLEIDKTKLDCDVVNEDLYESGELFPHIYGELPWNSVIAIHEFPRNEIGEFELPASVSV